MFVVVSQCNGLTYFLKKHFYPKRVYCPLDQSTRFKAAWIIFLFLLINCWENLQSLLTKKSDSNTDISGVHVLLVSLFGIPIVRSISHFFCRPKKNWLTKKNFGIAKKNFGIPK